MMGYLLLMMGLLLWTAAPASSQIIGPLDARGGGDIIRIGNRLAALPQGVQGVLPNADTSASTNSNSGSTNSAASDEVLRFGSMTGVSGSLVGTDQIRGVLAGGQPWQVTRGDGRLLNDGALTITVEGLILVEDGTNPVSAFRGLVSCLTADGGIANVLTGEFSANTAGDAQIEDTLELPFPCFAPLVFVTDPTGNWLASTGG